MKNKNYILISISVLLLTVLAGWLLWSNLTRASLNWVEGEKKMYKISFETFQNTSSPQFGVHSSGFTAKIETTLNFRVLEYNNGKVKLAFQFSPMKIELADRRLIQLEQLNSQLFLGEWTSDGLVTQWIFPSTISKKDEIGILQNLLAFQLIIKGDKHKWISEESDTLGNFIAKYNAKYGKVLKAKVKYTKIYTEDFGSTEEEDFQSNIQASYSELTPDTKGSWLSSASVQEKAEIAGGSFDISILRRGTLEQIPFEPDKSLDIWNDAFDFENVRFQMTKDPKKVLSIWEEVEQKRVEKEFHGESFTSLYAKFFKDPNKFTDLSLMEKMKEFLTYFPDEALKIPDLLLKEKISGNHVIEIIHLLAMTGHKQSQSAMVSILTNKKQTANARMQAIVGFHEVKKPDEESVSALWEIYNSRKTEQDRDYSNTAVLALGAAANHTQHEEVAGKDTLPAKIKTRMLNDLIESKSDPVKATVLLDALGNTGDSKLFPKIKDFANSDNKITRSSLYNSLGNFKDKDSLEFLRTQISKEESPEGRTKIIQSLLARKGGVDVTKTVQDSVFTEEDITTRNTMIQYLSQNRKDLTNFKQTMEKLLESEQNESNRELIYRSMYSELGK